MRKARNRSKLSVKGRFSKAPGLVSLSGRTKFARSIIKRRTNCNAGCEATVGGVYVVSARNNSPIELPLLFSKSITVDWDDQIRPGLIKYNTGDRVIHNYRNALNNADQAAAARNIRVFFDADDDVIVDYSEDDKTVAGIDRDSYFTTHKAAITADADLGAVAGGGTFPGKLGVIRNSLEKVKSWGSKGDIQKPVVRLRSLEGATKLTIVDAFEAPKVTKSLQKAFKTNSLLTEISSINKWSTKGVENMEGMFEDAALFVGVAGKFDLDTTSVKNMKNMFKGAAAFNRDLGDKFKTENVETMESMFEGATAFNKAINFETPKLGTNGKGLTAAVSMFKNATAFNQDVSKLDFRNVTDVTDTYLNLPAAMGAAKQAKLGEKKAKVDGNIINIENKTPLFFKGLAGAGGSVATGYVGDFYSQRLTGAGQAFQNMVTVAPLPFVSIITPTTGGFVATDQYTRVNFKKNRILAIEVRHTTSGDGKQNLLHAANVYIYFSKPVTLTEVIISEEDDTNQTTHTVANTLLAKIPAAATAATAAAGFTVNEIKLVTDGIGGVKPENNKNLTVYRLTGVDEALFGNGTSTAYTAGDLNVGLKIIFKS
jgi:hypothetical protein